MSEGLQIEKNCLLLMEFMRRFSLHLIKLIVTQTIPPVLSEAIMKKINGTNLGNWLVLEKWMQPEFFKQAGVEDEVWLNRKMDHDELSAWLKHHRDTYITEKDFQEIAAHGLNLVRIPVPFFIFGDRPPYDGCITYLDKAFDWAETYGIQILIDLHTVPGSQNGYDNGGITGVCKWHNNPDEVGFALSVLKRLAERYKNREGLFGIEVLNEPISFLVYLTAPSTGKAADKEEAKGSGYVPLPFLKQFYRNAYRGLREILPEEKVIVFHDGFRLGAWKDFFVKEGMKNVILDTHIYVFAMENFVPVHKPWVYQIYINSQKRLIEKTMKFTPVVVGEWCICNRYAESDQTCRKERYQEIAKRQLAAWNISAGQIYWSYQLLRDRDEKPDEAWKESWDLARCWKNNWMPG